MPEREWRGFTPRGGGVRDTAGDRPRIYSRDFLDSFWGGGSGPQFPRIDLSEDVASYIVTAELPGAQRGDIAVEIDAGALTIRGEKRRERDESRERQRFVERAFGAFERTLGLPADADCERVRARLENGVLTVTIAKRRERGARVVEIEGS